MRSMRFFRRGSLLEAKAPRVSFLPATLAVAAAESRYVARIMHAVAVVVDDPLCREAAGRRAVHA